MKPVCRGYLLFNRVIILEPSCANKVYWNGYFGSFFGVPKPRERGIKAPLELSLLEALYLLEKNLLKIYSGSKELSYSELYRYAIGNIPRFSELYRIYKDLRERGFVIRRGLKFGCDYLAYEYGPGIDHAPYGVQVLKPSEEFDPIDLVRMGRLLHSVRKKLIIALDLGGHGVKYVVLKWWRP